MCSNSGCGVLERFQIEGFYVGIPKQESILYVII
jgi:hypothetical protein